MDLGLQEKVAVITASSKGLGRAVAEEFAREGARLALCSRDERRIAETAGFIRDMYGVEVFHSACDLEDPAQVDAFAKGVLKRFGTVHVLFTNSGGPPPGTLDALSAEDFPPAINLNLMSAIRLTYAFLPAMKAQKWGRVIASTSITVKQPIMNLALSNVSRVGVVAFIKSLAREYASTGITANAIAPGYILTERVDHLFASKSRSEGRPVDEIRKDVTDAIPAGRIGRPDEFAALVAFLASERASYITGETILVDGAMHAGLF